MLNFHELLALQPVDRLRPETSFFLLKPATGACANRNDKHSDNDDIYMFNVRLLKKKPVFGVSDR